MIRKFRAISVGILIIGASLFFLGSRDSKFWSPAPADDLRVNYPADPDDVNVRFAAELDEPSSGDTDSSTHSQGSYGSTQDPVESPSESNLADEAPLLYRIDKGFDSQSGILTENLTIELERGENYSYLETTIDFDALLPASQRMRPDYMGDYASFTVRNVHYGLIEEHTLARGFEYFFVWVAPEKPGYYIFMTNDADMPIEDLLADLYTAEAQAEFDHIGYLPSRGF